MRDRLDETPQPGEAAEIELSGADLAVLKRRLAEPVDPLDETTREAMLARAMQPADGERS